MRFSCEKNVLCEAVTNVSRAVSSKSTVPALEGILLSARGQHLSLCGYDLEFSIKTEIPAKVTSEGEIVLSARIFNEMVRKMPSEKITIEADDKNLVLITGGSTIYTILGIPSQDFPEIPGVDGSSTQMIPGAVLKGMIDQTIYAVAVNDAKPAHMGSLFEFEEDHLTVVSVDGFRMAVRKEKIKTDGENRFIVPAKTLNELSKLLQDSDQICEINIAPKKIVFKIGNYTVFSRLIEGEFLQYKNAIPKSSSTQIIMKKSELINSLERVSLLIVDRLKSPVNCVIKEESISLSCDTAIGRANDVILCKYTGDDLRIGFNSKYMMDALKACDCDQIMIQFSGPLSPIILKPVESEEFLFLVLPVRLK